MTLGSIRRRLSIAIFLVLALISADSNPSLIHAITGVFGILGLIPKWDRHMNFGKGGFKAFEEL
jgi:hypothetical protein